MTAIKQKTANFRVIGVIDDTKIVVNAGSMNGVSNGHFCAILAPAMDAVDPETSENLGSFKLFKGKGVVSQCYEKFSIVSGKFEMEIKHHDIAEFYSDF